MAVPRSRVGTAVMVCGLVCLGLVALAAPAHALKSRFAKDYDLKKLSEVRIVLSLATTSGLWLWLLVVLRGLHKRALRCPLSLWCVWLWLWPLCGCGLYVAVRLCCCDCVAVVVVVAMGVAARACIVGLCSCACVCVAVRACVHESYCCLVRVFTSFDGCRIGMQTKWKTTIGMRTRTSGVRRSKRRSKQTSGLTRTTRRP